MITAFHIPTPPLNQIIDHIFYYSGYNTDHQVDRFLPDGEVQLIFDLTDEPKYIYDNESLETIQTCKNVWFSGFRTVPITIPSGNESEMLIIQFKKGKAISLIEEPMQYLTNLVVDAELIFNPEILNIRHSLLNIQDPSQKIFTLEEKLLQYFFKTLYINPFVDFAVSSIVKTPNQSSIKDIASKTGYSQKHMINIFKEHVGVKPKEFLKVMRFQKAIQQIEQQMSIDWTMIAYDCGFYDQSHFIADFKLFSGLTPTEYMKQRGDFLNYIPLK